MFIHLLIIIFCFNNPLVQDHTEEQLISKGLELEANQQYVQALDVWASAVTELDTPAFTIARHYIRLATRERLRDYYEKASSTYLWGLSGKMTPPNLDALADELSVLETLVDRSVFKKWKSLLDSQDPDLFRRLHQFWQDLDPTPATLYNERLIEHWERIATAQLNYTRNNKPPYGTDDRGPVYVKYGHPDRIKTGYLQALRGNVVTLCNQLGLCNNRVMPDIVMELQTNPYYEIWIYDRPNTVMEYNLVYIFGETTETGFGMVETLEQFIPRRAFSLTDRFKSPSFLYGAHNPGEKITPGMVMQWLYYEQLAHIDFFFEDRYTDIVFDWDRVDNSLPSIGKFQGTVKQEKNKLLTQINRNRAPVEMSTYTRMLPEIPLRIYHYRMLDDQNRPITATFLETQPRGTFLEDLALNEDALFPDDSVTAEQAFGQYELVNGLQIRSPSGEIVNRTQLPADLILDFREDLPSSSLFKIPLTDADHTAVFFSELHNRATGSQPAISTPFPNSLRGLGTLETPLPPPLQLDADKLLMADLILGYEMRSDVPADRVFPFFVSNEREIPAGEELALHIEIYNLTTDTDGFSHIRMDYETVPVRRMEWLRGVERESSLTIHQEISGNRYAENLEIKTRDLGPGRYRLRLMVIDLNSAEQVEQEIEFKIVENHLASGS